ncbi:MAG: hypothetical protein ACKOX3_05475, partial [Bacteroidota bacterium]
GCSITASTTITEPTAIAGSGTVTSNYNGSQLSCATSTDGAITVTASGGTGALEYSIDGGAYQSSAVFTSLAAGVHTISVKDANGCTYSPSSVTISAPALVSVYATPLVSTLSCNSLVSTSATAVPAGGSGTFMYLWTGGQTTATATGLFAGTYTVTATDANGCSANATITISNPIHTGNAWFVNDNSTSSDTFTNSVGTGTGIGTASCPFNTISTAISSASAGDTIYVDAGTYAENVTVDKKLVILGTGVNTIVNTTVASTKAFKVTASGSSATDRLVIKDMKFTGPSNTSGSDAISFEPTGSGAYVTVENVTISGHGYGVHFRSGTMSEAKVLNSRLNGNGVGLRVATAVTNMTGLTIDGCTMNNNSSSAISVNPSGTIANVNTNYTISNSTFTNNSTGGTANVHDISFYGFIGNATLNNVTVTSGNGTSSNSNSYGIVFTRGSGTGAIGNVSLNNVTVQGFVGKGALSFQLYNNVSGVSMNNVDVSNCVAPWGQLILDHTDANGFQLGNTTLKSLVLWNSGGVDATTAIFKHATTGAVLDRAVIADCFQTENQMVHKVDVSALGFVKLKAGNVYVTPNSYSSPTTTTASIQRGIDAASAGDILNVDNGTYTGQTLTVNKNLDIRGQGTGTIVQSSGNTVFTYTASGSGTLTAKSYLRNMKVSGSAKGVYASELVNYLTMEGVTFDGNSSYAVHLNNTSGVMNNWEIANCSFNGNNSAYYGSSQSNINGLSITNSTFTNQVGSAIAIYASSTNVGGCNNLTITGNTFSNNANASNNSSALYMEKVSNGLISGNTMTNNGTAANARGFIINTKYANHTNLTITNNVFIETRGSVTSGYGMQVAGRNDAPSYSAVPASLSNLTIANNEISGFYLGMSLENNVVRSSATVVNNKLTNCTVGFNTAGATAGSTTTISNNSFDGGTYALLNQDAGSSLDATCNYMGTLVANNIPSRVVGSNVTYSPWLNNSTDNDPSIGFQPMSG